MQQKPFSQANLFELVIKDEKQLRKIEALINDGVSTSQLAREISLDPKLTLQMLSKQDKTIEEYESKYPATFSPCFSYRTLPQGWRAVVQGYGVWFAEVHGSSTVGAGLLEK